MTATSRKVALGDPTRDHRRAPRREVVTHGVLIHGRALQGVRCTIRDVSAIGARVKLKAPEFLSRPLYLVIEQSALAFEADIAWCKDNELGVSFKGRLNLIEPTRELEKTLLRRWKAMPAP